MTCDVGRTPEEREFKNLRHLLKRTYKEDGFKGYYRGLPVSCSGIFLYRGLYFGLYDTFSGLTKNSGIFAKFICAQAVTLSAGILTYPISTLSTRLMMQSCRKEKQYKSTLEACLTIIQKEGVRGLFKGVSITIASGTGGAIALVAYDLLKMK